jgi:hypothetical protein
MRLMASVILGTLGQGAEGYKQIEELRGDILIANAGGSTFAIREYGWVAL